MKKKVLVVSYLPWCNEVSVGNTLTNLFSGLEDRFEFASLYFKGGNVINGIAQRFFYISEKELALSIINRKNVGKEICVNEREENISTLGNNIYDKARSARWESLLLCQDIIGILGKWKTKELDDFIEDYAPDMIFGPLGRVPVANLIMEYIHNKYKIPVVAYAWDDHYSWHKRSLSPFFWIKTIVERRYIKRCADISSLVYTITKEMQEEYQGYFGKECKVLYKAYNFEGDAPVKRAVDIPIIMTYMGNLGSGRWKELSKVVSVISKINKVVKKVELRIYSMSPRTEAMNKALNNGENSYLMKPVPNEEVISTMNKADILIHVEPTRTKERLFFRLSFSTKIVDYLFNARCILAIGGETAAMSYLKRNGAAIVVEDTDSLEIEINKLLCNKDKIIDMGYQAWKCGVNNHQKRHIQKMLIDDFSRIISKESY